MQIEVINVGVENKGKYRVANVQYKNLGGADPTKPEGKKLMSFTFKEVFNTLSAAQQGDRFDVKPQKNTEGFWEWTEASPTGKNTGVQESNQGFQTATKAARNYETSEERAKRQVYIVRQSSISAAIALAELNKRKEVTETDVIESARKFEQYVFDTEFAPEVEVV